MTKLLAILLLVCPGLALGHAMSPPSQVVQALLVIHTEDYTLRNDYKHPAVYEILIMNKDGSPADEWRTEQKVFKLLPGSERTFTLRFKVTETRKLLVCTRLTEIGKNNEKPSIRSTLCSRLIINSAS